jgi:hypothetical protein
MPGRRKQPRNRAGEKFYVEGPAQHNRFLRYRAERYVPRDR